MNLHNAFLQAADHVEARPDLFEFGEVSVPESCDAPGCTIGWVHFFAGIPGTSNNVIEAAHLPDLKDDDDFYERMDTLGVPGWRDTGADCAKALRLYADKYVPRDAFVDVPA